MLTTHYLLEVSLGQISWLEWGQDAFDKAKASGKPILLDITGSWCHWCHVMDKTSYSDPVIVSSVDKSFIPIRVDTDMRPDVNRRYNLGGWPTTAFLDGDGKIITGGTYIPPQQMRDVLRSVLEFYANNRGKIGSKIMGSRLPAATDQPLTEKITRDVATTIAVDFDMDYGGFGFEPKFPHSEALEYAMLRYQYQGEKEMLTVVTRTLERMAQGGIYDQVENGFFRYSTTRDWSIPHFEKMAEDNAKLLAVYVHAFQLTGNALYRNIAEGIVRYVQANLSDRENGGFFGSQDADEEYYKMGLAERKNHRAPAVDRTIFTNYNSIMVSSMLLGSEVMENDEIGRFALRSLDRLIELGKKTTMPFRYWKDDGTPVFKGFLTDYATLLHALLDAYEYSNKHRYLEIAVEVANDCIKSFHDGVSEGFYDIIPSESALGELRSKDKPMDENSLLVIAMLRLSWHTSNDEYSNTARKTLGLFTQDYERYGLASAIYGQAVDYYMNGPVEITIVAGQKSNEFKKFKRNALGVYSARRYINYLDPVRESAIIASRGYNTAVPVAYVCVGKTCGPPLTDPSQINTSLTSLLKANPLTTS